MSPKSSSARKHHVVIVGASVAGIRAAAMLVRDARNDVTLIHDGKDFEFLSSLNRDKKGRSHRHIKLPLKDVFSTRLLKHIHLVRAEIVSVDPESKRVTTSKKVNYSYDSLLFALESQPALADVSERANVYNAYQPEQMQQLRRKLMVAFESGDTPEKIAFIGGGETGIELAAELRALVDQLAKRYKRSAKKVEIMLLEANKMLLNEKRSSVSDKCRKRLQKIGVKVSLNKKVDSVSKLGVKLSGDKIYPADITVVAAGTISNEFFARNKDHFILSRDGFVRCNDLLEAVGYNDIYIIGNNRDSDSERDMGEAIYDAEYVVTIMENKQSGKTLPSYKPPNHYFAVSIGRYWAAYVSNKSRFGRRGWAKKRWIELKHFATLLPKRTAIKVWLLGSKHDAIN